MTYLGIRIHEARKACKLKANAAGAIRRNGSVNPSYEILFPIVNRLGLTTSDLFSVEPDQHMEEINRFLGKFRACNRSNQLLLLDTLDFLVEQLLARQNEKHEGMG